MSSSPGSPLGDPPPSLSSDRRLGTMVTKKKFPRVLIVSLRQNRITQLTVEFTRKGFVTESAMDVKSAQSKWKYPGFHDLIVIDFQLGEFNAVYLAQALRRKENDQQYLSRIQKQQRSRLLRLVSADASSEALRMQILGEGVQKSIIMAMWDHPEEHRVLEASKVFDGLMRHPIEVHTDFLQEIFVSEEGMPKLEKCPTIPEMMKILATQHLYRLPGDTMSNLVTESVKAEKGFGIGLGGSPTNKLQQEYHTGAVEAAMKRYEAQIADIEDDLQHEVQARLESEKETDACNLKCQKLREELQNVTDDRDTLNETVSALEGLIDMRAKDIEKIKKDFSYLRQMIANETGGDFPLMLGESPSGALLHTPASTTSSMGGFGGALSDSVMDAKVLVDENNELREQIFAQQSEVHLLRTELKNAEIKYHRMKAQIIESRKQMKDMQETNAAMEQERQQSKRLSNSSFSRFGGFSGGGGLLRKPAAEDWEYPTSPTSTDEGTPSPAPASKGLARFRKSIATLTQSIKVSKKLGLGFSPGGPGDGTRGGGGGMSGKAPLTVQRITLEKVSQRTERNLMALHDELSRVSIHENFFFQGLAPRKLYPAAVAEKEEGEEEGFEEREGKEGEKNEVGGDVLLVKEGVPSRKSTFSEEGQETSAVTVVARRDFGVGKDPIVVEWEDLYRYVNALDNAAKTFYITPALDATAELRTAGTVRGVLAVVSAKQKKAGGGRGQRRRQHQQRKSSSSPSSKATGTAGSSSKSGSPPKGAGSTTPSATATATPPPSAAQLRRRTTIVTFRGETTVGESNLPPPPPVAVPIPPSSTSGSGRKGPPHLSAVALASSSKKISGRQSTATAAGTEGPATEAEGEGRDHRGTLWRPSPVLHQAQLKKYIKQRLSFTNLKDLDLEKVYNDVFGEFKTFLEVVLHRYKTLFNDMTVDTMKLFHKEDQYLEYIKQRNITNTNQKADGHRIVSEDEANEPILGAEMMMLTRRFDDTGGPTAAHHNRPLEVERDFSATARSVGASSALGGHGDAPLASTFSGDFGSYGSPRQATTPLGSPRHRSPGAASGATRHNMSTSLELSTEAFSGSRYPQQHHQPGSPLLGTTVGSPFDAGGTNTVRHTHHPVASHVVLQHLSRHFHHIQRQGLKGALELHLELLHQFAARVVKSVDALNSALAPLQNEVQHARSTGAIKPTRDGASQTDPVAFASEDDDVNEESRRLSGRGLGLGSPRHGSGSTGTPATVISPKLPPSLQVKGDFLRRGSFRKSSFVKHTSTLMQQHQQRDRSRSPQQ